MRNLASLQVDLSFLSKMNIALQLKLNQDTQFYWKSIKIKLKKQKFCLKS